MTAPPDWMAIAQAVIAAVPAGADRQRVEYILRVPPLDIQVQQLREAAEVDDFAQGMLNYARNELAGRGQGGVL